MERIKKLGLYQKIVLIILIVMTILFSVLYPVTIARKGFEYRGEILVPQEDDGNTVYSGKVYGKPAAFTVASDKTVTSTWGDKVWGPYTIKEDPSAISNDVSDAFADKEIVGFELYCNDRVIFRGCMVITGSGRMLFNDAGEYQLDLRIASDYDTSAYDEYGNEIDQMEPTVFEIIELMAGPQLTHKGNGLLWLCGFVVCAAAAVSILYADELFRWNMSFRVRDADHAEPAEWEIMGRYISWTLLPLVAAAVYIMGLN